MACSSPDSAFIKAMDAAYAMERAARRYGPCSEEARLARKAYELFIDDYRELTKGAMERNVGAAEAVWQGDKLYDC